MTDKLNKNKWLSQGRSSIKKDILERVKKMKNDLAFDQRIPHGYAYHIIIDTRIERLIKEIKNIK